MRDWLLDHGVKIAIVVVLIALVLWLVRRVLPKAIRLAVQADRTGDVTSSVALEEQIRRADTLSHVVVRTIDLILVFVGVLVVLGEVGVAIGPLLAGAGIVGIALGFGAQSLVRDTLAGLFILIENQYGQGDIVELAGITGKVEDVNLRRTVIRDLDGVVHTVSNGEIQISANKTRGWSGINVDISVAYGEDLDRAQRVIDRVGAELAADPEWAPLLLEQPEVRRVQAFEESGITLKVLGKTKPMKQWDVVSELRRRIKIAFDAESIEIPFPHRTIVVRRDDADRAAALPTGDGGPPPSPAAPDEEESDAPR